MRKSQISLFIIIGLALVLLIGLVSYKVINSTKKNIEQEKGKSYITDNYINQIKFLVDDCLETVSEELIKIQALRGGYISNSQIHFSTLQGDFSYLMFRDHNFVPTKSEMELELGNEISKKIPYCIRNFESLKEKGINITHGGINTEVTLNDNTVVIILNYNIEVMDTTDNKISFSQFETTHRNRLKVLREVSNEIVNTQINNLDSVNSEFFEDIEKREDVSIFIYPTLDDRTYVYSIRDNNNNKIENKLNFQFANKFKYEKVPDFS